MTVFFPKVLDINENYSSIVCGCCNEPLSKIYFGPRQRGKSAGNLAFCKKCFDPYRK